jgi:hypothetical protein
MNQVKAHLAAFSKGLSDRPVVPVPVRLVVRAIAAGPMSTVASTIEEIVFRVLSSAFWSPALLAQARPSISRRLGSDHPGRPFLPRFILPRAL